MSEDRFVIEDKLWLIASPVGVPIYDFDFRRFFDCRTPYQSAPLLPGVARIGAFPDYAQFHATAASAGIALLNSPAEQERCSVLTGWYPLISDLTARTRCFATVPTFDELADHFGLPVFVKGARQTSRHRAAASIVRTREDYARVSALFRADSILQWQTFACRELLNLRPVPGDAGDRLPPSFEFRTFWRRDRLLAAGRYWHEVPEYRWTGSEQDAALALAQVAASRLDCGFLVIDLAMTADGRWVIIECNDAMESGYAGVSPFLLWRSLLDTLPR